MTPRHRRQRGISLLEVLLALGLLVVVVAVLWPAFQRMRTGAYPIADAGDMTRVHQALLRGAQSEGGGVLPMPSRIVGGSGPPELSADTTANLYSWLIGQRLIEPGSLISRGEENPLIEACEYDYSRVNSVAGAHWDPGFRTDLDRADGVCHTSYAHLALGGERRQRWMPVMDSTSPLLGDRGPYRGIRSGNSFLRSYTVGRYGHGGRWQGTIVFADNHSEYLSSFYPNLAQWGCGSIQATKDNIFDCEFDQTDCTGGVRDGRVAGDCWLCITQSIDGAKGLVSDAKELLRDGSLPR